MADLTLTKTRIHAGHYEGVLTAPAGHDPELGAFLNEQPVGELVLTPDPEAAATWNVVLSLPPDILTDGIQTFLLVDQASNTTLDSFTVITGEPLDDDLRGEIDLLRAELDMLKKAFRRHCVETS
ncbi:hypothetical protein [uncultured Litoreibacter sp.]|uniref:hypothetical protein n=1 Tax=uncultured Litoreibacter sp. TaxID=1392394 RepID=UPI00260C472D|nr:hypothetical protein [uncultured Litoreibacter sp.]